MAEEQGPAPEAGRATGSESPLGGMDAAVRAGTNIDSVEGSGQQGRSPLDLIREAAPAPDEPSRPAPQVEDDPGTGPDGPRGTQDSSLGDLAEAGD